MKAAILELEAQLNLRASEEALKRRTEELAACRSERDQLLAALKLRCDEVAPHGGEEGVTVTPSWP